MAAFFAFVATTILLVVGLHFAHWAARFAGTAPNKKGSKQS
jgi:hypothetical protein